MDATNGKAILFRKMAQVLADVQRVPKNGYNSFHKYPYVMEADLVDALRPALGKHGVAVFVNVAEIENRGGDITRVRIEVTFGCGETGETQTVSWYGDGQDKADKGLYKAYTGALKYALMKTFLVSTGDDPEADGAEQPTARPQPKPVQAPQPQPQPAAKGATNGQTPPTVAPSAPQATNGTNGKLAPAAEEFVKALRDCENAFDLRDVFMAIQKDVKWKSMPDSQRAAVTEVKEEMKAKLTKVLQADVNQAAAGVASNGHK